MTRGIFKFTFHALEYREYVNVAANFILLQIFGMFHNYEKWEISLKKFVRKQQILENLQLDWFAFFWKSKWYRFNRISGRRTQFWINRISLKTLVHYPTTTRYAKTFVSEIVTVKIPLIICWNRNSILMSWKKNMIFWMEVCHYFLSGTCSRANK